MRNLLLAIVLFAISGLFNACAEYGAPGSETPAAKTSYQFASSENVETQPPLDEFPVDSTPPDYQSYPPVAMNKLTTYGWNNNVTYSQINQPLTEAERTRLFDKLAGPVNGGAVAIAEDNIAWLSLEFAVPRVLKAINLVPSTDAGLASSYSSDNTGWYWGNGTPLSGGSNANEIFAQESLDSAPVLVGTAITGAGGRFSAYTFSIDTKGVAYRFYFIKFNLNNHRAPGDTKYVYLSELELVP